VTQWVAELTFAVLEHDAAAFIYLVLLATPSATRHWNLWHTRSCPPSAKQLPSADSRPWRVGRVRNPKAAEGPVALGVHGDSKLRGPTLSRAAPGRLRMHVPATAPLALGEVRAVFEPTEPPPPGGIRASDHKESSKVLNNAPGLAHAGTFDHGRAVDLGCMYHEVPASIAMSEDTVCSWDSRRLLRRRAQGCTT